MTLRLTPEIMEGSYIFLAVTPPFNKLKMPPPDDIEFHVTRDKTKRGDFVDAGDAYVIRISQHLHKTADELLQTMAHEMAHAAQERYARRERHHGSYFKALARRICKVHGWSEKTF